MSTQAILAEISLSRLGLLDRNNFWLARQNEAARAADASREANGAVYGERLK
jgi:hypothetical protein